MTPWDDATRSGVLIKACLRARAPTRYPRTVPDFAVKKRRENLRTGGGEPGNLRQLMIPEQQRLLETLRC